ncbi:MAG: double zinc ribbon domain-containing protein [Actinomycetota bacterium]|nr:double zinc ribbon domain-containing protein [Actinomycetota bacterium]
MISLLDVVAPERCAVCGLGELALCERCRRSLVLLRPPLCARCGAETAWPLERCAECARRRLPFRSARAAVVYDERARRLVAGWKERGLRRLAALLADVVVDTVPRPPADALVFVPGDPDRARWRGHNTAEGLACALAKRWRVAVVPALERARRVPPQRSLPRAERRVNTRGSFRARVRPPARVVLIDDVYTTGATVSAAATALRAAGARTVDVVTFARVARR